MEIRTQNLNPYAASVRVTPFYGCKPDALAFSQKGSANEGTAYWYNPVRAFQPFPTHHVTMNLRFGAPGCGVCPMCVIGMAAANRVNKIRDLERQSDLTIDAGLITQELRALAIKGNGLDETTFKIQNFDGTRLHSIRRTDQRSTNDAYVIELAALPRTYHTKKLDKYTIHNNTDDPIFQDAINGLNGKGLVVSELKRYSKTETVPIDEKAILPDGDALRHQFRTYGTFHHLNEKTRGNKTTPLLVGYTTLTEKLPGELLVASVRELPQLEGIGADAGGLMNAIGVAAKSTRYNSVAVFVEPYQVDLVKYLRRLQENGINVQEYGVGHKLPEAYEELLSRYNSRKDKPAGTIYRIDLAQIKAFYQASLAKLNQEKFPTLAEVDVDFLTNIQDSDETETCAIMMDEAEQARYRKSKRVKAAASTLAEAPPREEQVTQVQDDATSPAFDPRQAAKQRQTEVLSRTGFLGDLKKGKGKR